MKIPMFAKDKTNDPMYLEKARELSCCDHSELIVLMLTQAPADDIWLGSKKHVVTARNVFGWYNFPFLLGYSMTS